MLLENLVAEAEKYLLDVEPDDLLFQFTTYSS
jgi:hypothetical protein